MLRSHSASDSTHQETAHVKLTQSHYSITHELRRRATLAAEQGKYQAAIAYLREIIKHRMGQAADYNQRGLLYVRLNCLAAAIADYNRALQLNPNFSDAYFNRASYYEAVDNVQKAVNDYSKAIRANPQNLHAWIKKGILLRDFVGFQQSIQTLDIALKISKALSTSDFLKAKITAEQGRSHYLAGDSDAAKTAYQTAQHFLTKINLIHQPKTFVQDLQAFQQQVKTWTVQVQN